MTNASVLELRGVSKELGGRPVLSEVSLEVRPGEFLTLLGPSGCGKTTTLRVVAGFETPDSGRVLLGGRDVTDVPSYKRDVHTVFQHYALFPHLDVLGNVGFGLSLRGVPPEEIRRQAAEALRVVSLEGMEARLPDQLSGGQRQRVAVARALVGRPGLLLLDEPLGALDLKLRKGMQLELKRIQRETGIAFVYVTHDQEEAMTMSDRIAVMEGGRIVQLGSPREIYQRPASRFVAEFVGGSNLLRARLVKRRGAAAELLVEGEWPVLVPDAGGREEGAELTVAIRPEAIAVRPGEEAQASLPLGDSPAAGPRVRLPCELRQVVFMGSNSRAYLSPFRESGRLLEAVLGPGEPPREGKVVAEFRAEDLHVFSSNGGPA